MMKDFSMASCEWKTTILSDQAYEHLVAEVSFDSQFLFLLDREQGRDFVCISFPEKNGQLGARIPLAEFVERLQAAAENLRR